MRGTAVFDQLSAGDYSLDTATTRLTMNSAEGVVQRGVVELGRPAASRVPAGTVEVVPVRALLLGERLDTRALERDKPLGIAPLTVEIAGGGIAVLFRYGAIVLFGMATAAIDSFVASLKPLIAGIFSVPEQDEVRLVVRPDIDEQVDPSGKSYCTRRRRNDCSSSQTFSPRAWYFRITKQESPISSIALNRSLRRYGKRDAPERAAKSCCAISAMSF
jgi:hypothetical protein